MTIDELKERGWIIMDAVVGSQSFGLATETSDVDTRGVFIIPMNYRIGYEYIDQVADEQNNHVYWELSKFIELLNKANPSSLEFLNSAPKDIITGAEWFDYFRQYDWLSMQCRDTFVKYAQGQLQRAYGLNKKVFDPQPEEPPKILDFCHVIRGNDSIPLRDFMHAYGDDDQKWYAISAIDHIDNGFAIFHEPHLDDVHADAESCGRWAYGFVRDENKSNELQLNSIPKGIKPIGSMFYNKNAYSRAYKLHTEYWAWVKMRNEERYANTMKQGKGYDAKNVMHCIRLLMTAKDIAINHIVTVDRSKDREFLFDIKHAKYSYDEVVKLGNDMVNEVIAAFDNTTLKPSGFSYSELGQILREALVWSKKQENYMIV